MRTGLNLCSWSSWRTCDVFHVPQCERYKRTAITPQESDVGLNYREHRLRDYGEKKTQNISECGSRLWTTECGSHKAQPSLSGLRESIV